MCNESGNKGNEILERHVLYGNRIVYDSVPEQRGLHDDRPLVEFVNNRGHRFILGEKMAGKGTLLIGGTGYGKTNAFFHITDSILNSLTANDIVIIFDTKGDFKKRYYKPLKSDEHILIGNSAECRGDSRRWDLFGELENNKGEFDIDSETNAQEIASALVDDMKETSQPFFPMAAENLLSIYMRYLMRESKITGIRPTTEQFVNGLQHGAQAFRDAIEKYDDFKGASMYFGTSGNALNNQALGVFGMIRTVLDSKLSNNVFSGKIGGLNCYSMRKIVRERRKQVVFLEYDMSRGNTLGSMYRLMIDLALKEALGLQENRGNGNIYIIADEFKLLGAPKHMEDALNFGRDKGVKTFIGIQSVKQLFEVYGEARAQVLLAGMTNAFCFNTPDPATREYIVGRFGKTYEVISYEYGKQKSQSYVKTGNTVEDWNILDLRPGEAIIDLCETKPFKFKFMKY